MSVRYLSCLTVVCLVGAFFAICCSPRHSDSADTGRPQMVRTHPQSPELKLLSQIFDPDMLGAQVGYLERVTGLSAWRVDGATRSYRVGKCVVTISADQGNSIEWLRLAPVNRDCSFNLAPFLKANSKFDVGNATFAEFEATLGADNGE